MKIRMGTQEKLLTAVGGFLTYIGSATLAFMVDASFWHQIIFLVISGTLGILASLIATLANTYFKYYLTQKRRKAVKDKTPTALIDKSEE